MRLLNIDAPDNTVLASASLSLRGLIPAWSAALLLLAAAAGAFLLYFREGTRLGAIRRVGMALLRTALIGLVLVLLLRPVLVAEFHGQRPRPVALLLDNSQSMKQQDRRLDSADRVRVAIAKDLLPPGTSVADTTALSGLAPDALKDPERVELVRAVLANPTLRLPEGLRGRGPLQQYLVGRRLTAGSEGTSLPLEANEAETALADAIHDLLNRRGTDLPAALVLATDGRDNASKLSLREAALECKDAGVPLHVYGVGASESVLLQLKELNVADTIFVDDTVAVTVRGQCRGFKSGKLLLTLALGEQQADPVEVDVGKGGEFRQVVQIVPGKGAEQRELAATVRLRGNDAFTSAIRRPVRVVENRVKVLYVENTPRWEFKFLQPALLRDRRVESRFLLVEGDPGLMQAGPPFLERFPERFPETTEKDPDQRPFDLLILGDVPARTLVPEGARAVRKFVREGGGLVCIAGRHHLPSEYVAAGEDESLAEVLPVEFGRAEHRFSSGTRPRPFKPLLTDDGKSSEWSTMLTLADDPAENTRLWAEGLWKDSGGFYWHYPVTRLRAGARALLVHPELKASDRGEPPLPVVAAQHYGKGQVLFLGTDETWRWRFNAHDRHLARFWGQVIYQMGLPHLLGNAERVQLAVNRSEAVVGRPFPVHARLLDEKNEPLRTERVLARVEQHKDGEVVTQDVEFKPVAGQDGEYQALLAHDTPGRYEVKGLKLPTGQELPPAQLQYWVDLPPRHELEEAGMAEDDLREAAEVSGGRFYREEDLGRLVESVEPRSAAFVHRQEVLLWNPLAWVLFVALITAEWLLRKFSNLS